MGIKVLYKGKPNEKLDKEITKKLGEKFKWYGQGYDFEKDERDIVFDYIP